MRFFFTAFVLTAVASSAHAEFFNFTNEYTIFSNTFRGGGPSQPYFYVEAEVPAGFSGDLPHDQWTTMSSEVVYGSYEPITFDGNLVQGTLSFFDGQLVDANIAIPDPETGTVLAYAGGDTTPVWSIAGPGGDQSPAVPFPGFDFEGEFAAGRLSTEMTYGQPLYVGTQPQPMIPRTPRPTAEASTTTQMTNGFMEFNASGGLYFDTAHSSLNSAGPFSFIGGFDHVVAEQNEPDSSQEGLRFTNININPQGFYRMAGSDDVQIDHSQYDPQDHGYWLLSSEATSRNEIAASFAQNVNNVCAALIGLGMGVCSNGNGVNQASVMANGDFDDGSVVMGLFENQSVQALNLQGIQGFGDVFSLLSGASGLEQLSVQFEGEVTYQAVTLPIMEYRRIGRGFRAMMPPDSETVAITTPEPTSLLLMAVGITGILALTRHRWQPSA